MSTTAIIAFFLLIYLFSNTTGTGGALERDESEVFCSECAGFPA
jgi:hypothetical protein